MRVAHALQFLTLCFALGGGSKLCATHNLAGEVTYVRKGTNTYDIVVTTYTDPCNNNVDNCTVEVEVWALQGGAEFFVQTLTLPRVNPSIGPGDNDCTLSSCTKYGEQVRESIKKNIYRFDNYVFSGTGLFELRFYNANRIAGVANMTSSVTTTFYVETVLNNSVLTGPNNSPTLLNLPLDDACTNKPWTHNPGGYDPDGDSLSYTLIACQQYEPPFTPQPVPCTNYSLPNVVGGGSLSIDPATGLITWDSPQVPGIYNLAIEVSEWRNGQRIGYIIRDMAIFVDICNNDPPIIAAITDTCVEPGTFLTFEITVDDTNDGTPPPEAAPGDSVYFMLNNAGLGLNGPFAVPTNPARITYRNTGAQVPPTFELADFQQPGIFDFEWTVTCEHLRRQFYQVDLYAHDDILHGGSTPWRITLADNHVVKIRVRPDPVTGLVVQKAGNRSLQLNWDPATCDNALGYRIYRGTDSLDPELDSVCCESNTLPAAGYEEVAFVTGWANTSYLDTGLAFRPQYCYRVVAVFEGDLRSCPSNVDCEQIERDVVVITNDSIGVVNTDETNGAAFVSWAPPDTLDAAFFPPPYRYTLQRRLGAGPFTTVATNLADTTYVDAGLNTVAEAVTYRVRIFDNGGTEIENAASDTATSIFLRIQPRFEALELSWTVNVPWTDTLYEVWFSPDSSGPFARYDTLVPGSGNGTYTLRLEETPTGVGFLNGEDYCFFVRGRGSYFSPGLKDPLINDSQLACGMPQDTIPPCLPEPPVIEAAIVGDCETFTLAFDFPAPNRDSCDFDTETYNVYYGRTEDATPQLLYALDTARFEAPITGSIVGCYYLSVTDTAGNESELSAPVCLESCALLELPNVFTPNGDGANDFLRPILARSVERLELTIYDRWGRVVLEPTNFNAPTTATELWDGKARASGSDAPAGVYYYVVRARLDNLARSLLERAGTVTLLR